MPGAATTPDHELPVSFFSRALPMTNDEIAAVLQETADLIELTDGNPHRARAFSRAARSLTGLEDAVTARLKRGTLTEVRGIGDAMASHVSDIVASGTFDQRDELLNAIPPGLLDVMRVKGLGTKRTRRLWTELNITTLPDLEEAAETNRITDLSGFGAKTQENILQNVRRLREYDQQWRLADAWTAVTPILEMLRPFDQVERAERTGPLRRHQETVDRADVVVATARSAAVREALARELDDTITEEDGHLATTLPEGIPLRIHLTSPDEFGTAWWKTTGAPAHCNGMSERFGEPASHPSEEDLFDAFDLPVIPPELREHQGEITAAQEDRLPSLLRMDEISGCLHNHSTYSDGSASLREMATAARSLGYTYFGISDHSQSLRIANGLTPTEVADQHDEIQTLNEEFAADADGPFRIFHGIESDILRDGSLDYGDETLGMFDFVVASVHTGFSMSKSEATERIITAVKNPHTRILGHPTGRLLLRREGYPIDHNRVIEACAEHDVSIELNANPYRLDLDWRWVRTATNAGVSISINPDAHSIPELENVRWGVAVARKGWLTADQCLNAKSLDAFSEWIDTGHP